MKALSIVTVLALLLGACAPANATARPVSGETSAPSGAAASPSPTVPALTATVQLSPVYTVTEAAGYVDTYLVEPGLDDPTPPLGGRVLVRAKLMKNGLRLWFAPTQVNWTQGDAVQLCEFLPMYLAGCIIEVRDFAPSAFVPVTVTMRYQGMTFTGYTGFTPVLPAVESTPTVLASSVYTVTGALGYVDTYFVDPGVDDPTPPLGGRVLVRARLFKNGVRTGGFSRVTWVQGGELQVCDLLPAYLSGCIIEVRDFTPGVFVPITVTARYLDMVFTGHSGFTPK